MKRIGMWAGLGALALGMWLSGGQARAMDMGGADAWLAQKAERLKMFIRFKVFETLEELNGTVSQFRDGKQIASDLGDAVIARLAAERTLHKAFLTQWESDTIDDASLQSALASAQGAEQAFTMQLVSSFTKFHDLLSPSQRAELAKEWGAEVAPQPQPQPEPQPQPPAIPQPPEPPAPPEG